MRITRILRSTPPFRPDEYIQQARQAVAQQPPKVTYDFFNPIPSRLLNLSLLNHIPDNLHPDGFVSDFKAGDRMLRDIAAVNQTGDSPAPNPEDNSSPPAKTGRPPNRTNRFTKLFFRPPIPLGHHLLYFPLQLPGHSLAPDGGDPDHAPGPPFVRRLWAGGSITFSSRYYDSMRLDSSRAVCVEEVRTPSFPSGQGAGQDGSSPDRVNVEVDRRYGMTPLQTQGPVTLAAVREQPCIQESRNFVFLKEGDQVEPFDGQPEQQLGKKIRDERLLFQFSALTYNAHRIHFDPQYAREQEGHRGALVHGSLSLVLMLTLLRSHIESINAATGTNWTVRQLRYSFVSPLVAGEPMKVCLGAGHIYMDGITKQKWKVWVEGPDGRLAVRGTAIANFENYDASTSDAEKFGTEL